MISPRRDLRLVVVIRHVGGSSLADFVIVLVVVLEFLRVTIDGFIKWWFCSAQKPNSTNVLALMEGGVIVLLVFPLYHPVMENLVFE